MVEAPVSQAYQQTSQVNCRLGSGQEGIVAVAARRPHTPVCPQNWDLHVICPTPKVFCWCFL